MCRVPTCQVGQVGQVGAPAVIPHSASSASHVNLYSLPRKIGYLAYCKDGSIHHIDRSVLPAYQTVILGGLSIQKVNKKG